MCQCLPHPWGCLSLPGLAVPWAKLLAAPWPPGQSQAASLVGEAAALAADVTLLLLALAQVVAGSPFAGSELQAAALRLMQNLHSKIHRAVGAMWAAEIPLLLQCLEGKMLVGREGRRQGRGGSENGALQRGRGEALPAAPCLLCCCSHSGETALRPGDLSPRGSAHSRGRMGPSRPLRQQSWGSSVFLLGQCLWGGTGHCEGCAGPSLAVPSAQASLVCSSSSSVA